MLPGVDAKALKGAKMDEKMLSRQEAIILSMTKAHGGSAVVVDKDRNLLGIFTDGDFRRKAENDMEILSRKVGDVMTKHPASIRADALAVEVLKVVEARKIDDIIVLDADGKVVGIVDIQDLPGLKLM